MFYKIARFLDNFFEEIKYMVTLVVFFCIAMAVLFFIYWLVFSARLTMPYWLELFVWNVIDFWAQGIKGTPLYREIVPILPVLVCGIFVVITYFLNCFIVFLESNHKLLNQKVEDYKQNIAKKINEELHHDFINELKKNSHMLLKIKISATMHSSYLTAMTDVQVDTDKLEDKLIYSSYDNSLPLQKDNEYLIFSEKRCYDEDYQKTLECNEYSMGLRNVGPTAFILNKTQQDFINISDGIHYGDLKDKYYTCFSQKALDNVNKVSAEIICQYT